MSAEPNSAPGDDAAERRAFAEVTYDPRCLPSYRAAVEVVRRLREAGHAAYLVGGGVRDLVMGLKPKDFDIVTSATPNETQSLFSRYLPIGAQFGVVQVRHKNHAFEVATFRAEGGYRDGRRPEWVRFSDLEADVGRRDFTINGLVLDPDEGRILDRCGGLADIRRGIVRTIGDPSERFGEDCLRMLRAVRFAARFGYRLDRGTKQAIIGAAATIGRVATERIWAELELMWADRNRVVALALLRDTGLLPHVVPALAVLLPRARGGRGFWARTRRRVEALPPDTASCVVWACLLADALSPREPPEKLWDDDGPRDQRAARAVEDVMAALRAPRNVTRAIAGLIARRWVWRRQHDLRRGGIARLLRRDTRGHLLLFWSADASGFGRRDAALPLAEIADDLRASGRTLDGPELPPVTGDDLIACGIAPGPRMQGLVAESERAWLERRLEVEDDVRTWLARVRDSGS